ncbi:hypothetical protein CEXT_184851 [Caerostris extrusa]|uniref:Uncharacterized protein n=1 Tax=Caerostris extrusa TaxID=172846 RepID=A0AAV4Y0S0_CAEEX|nr:hypothetical protein CEXT_184851 [Caerostris extrusa]
MKTIRNDTSVVIDLEENKEHGHADSFIHLTNNEMEIPNCSENSLQQLQNVQNLMQEANKALEALDSSILALEHEQTKEPTADELCCSSNNDDIYSNKKKEVPSSNVGDIESEDNKRDTSVVIDLEENKEHGRDNSSPVSANR